MKTCEIDAVRRVLNDPLQRYSLVHKARPDKARTVLGFIRQ